MNYSPYIFYIPNDLKIKLFQEFSLRRCAYRRRMNSFPIYVIKSKSESIRSFKAKDEIQLNQSNDKQW